MKSLIALAALAALVTNYALAQSRVIAGVRRS